MSALWIALAFIGGMAFMWKVAGLLLYKALKRSVIFERGLGRMDYEALLRAREAVDREIGKRQPKEAA